MMEYDDIGIKDEDDVLEAMKAGAYAEELHDSYGERILGLLLCALDKKVHGRTRGEAQGESVTQADLEEARLDVASWGHTKTVREIVAAGAMDGKTLRPTLDKVEDLVAAGKKGEAIEYVAKVSHENQKRWEKERP